MAQFRTSRTFDVIFVLVLLAGLGLAYFNRTTVNDWVFFATHKPSGRAAEVAKAAGLTNLGARLLYRADPQFADAATIKSVCDIERLGCLTEHGQMYVLDDPSRPNQTVVTAAHEMLHLAYRRLTATQRDDLAPDLRAGIDTNLDNGIRDELSDLTSTADRLDEAHSLLGTEYPDISSSLETYYRMYFLNRQTVLAAEAASEHE